MKQKKKSLKELGENFHKTRSEKDFTELYYRIKPGLFVYINNIVKDSDESNNILSHVMSSVYDKIDKYDPKWHISTWIYRIAYTHACMALRNRKSSKTTPLSAFEAGENKNWISKIEFDSFDEYKDHLIIQEEEAKYNEGLSKLKSVLKNLPEEYRVVLEEKFFNDLKYNEIAEKLNLPLHTIKNRLARGKKLIKEAYE